jgi:hypothetical protein
VADAPPLSASLLDTVERNDGTQLGTSWNTHQRTHRQYEFIDKMLLVTEAVAAVMTSGDAGVQLAEYIHSTRIEALAMDIFVQRIPLATLLLYGVLVPKAVGTGLCLDARYALRVLQEYFLALHVKRSDGSLETYPESVQVLVKDLPNEVD